MKAGGGGGGGVKVKNRTKTKHRKLILKSRTGREGRSYEVLEELPKQECFVYWHSDLAASVSQTHPCTTVVFSAPFRHWRGSWIVTPSRIPARTETPEFNRD